MTINFDPSQDLANAVDGTESVALRRRGSQELLTVTTALRRDHSVAEAEPSGGFAQQADAEWFLQLPEGAEAPDLGDVVIDQQRNHWTILTVDHQSLLRRWRCSTRELRLTSGCDDYVDVQRAVWGDLGEGPVIVNWTDVYTALPVKIQPDVKTASDTSNAPNLVDRFTFILGDTLPIEVDDRFVGADGSIYRLKSLEQQERIDKLPIAVVERVST